MTGKQKVIAWVSIIGAGLGTSFATAIKFFPDWTGILTAGGGLLGAIIALIVTKKSK